MPCCDSLGQNYTLRFRYWVNNQSRMYLLEGTQEAQVAPSAMLASNCAAGVSGVCLLTSLLACLQAKYKVQAGDSMVFGKLPDGLLVLCGQHHSADRTGLPSQKAASKVRSAPSAGKLAGPAGPAPSNGHPSRAKRQSLGATAPHNKASQVCFCNDHHAHSFLRDSALAMHTQRGLLVRPMLAICMTSVIA